MGQCQVDKILHYRNLTIREKERGEMIAGEILVEISLI